MSETSHQPLTASEIAHLWSCYMTNSMTSCVLTYGLGLIQDQDIHPQVQQAYDDAVQVTSAIESIFTAEAIPVPVGFTDQDVNINAKRLFQDTFFLDYINKMGKLGTAQYAKYHSGSTRKDIRAFFSNCVAQSSMMYDQSTDIKLSKGLQIRSPYIATPNKVQHAGTNHYFSGLNPLSNKRTLNVVEISHLNLNMETNMLGVMISTGFGQTAASQKVRDYMLEGKNVSEKHLKSFGKLLAGSDIQAPMTWDSAVSDSTDAPFSDKLMMYHMSVLSAASISNYGAAASQSLRSDLTMNYPRLAAEIAQFTKKGADLMIKNGWMEVPPQTVDRDKLIKQKGE